MLGLKTKVPAQKRVLRAIERKPGITTRELADITHKFSSRISDARKDGYIIEKRPVVRYGKFTGFYGYYIVPPGEYGDEY
jgi:hypothetical protein